VASGPNIVLDITRLVTRFSRPTPNGIDRVDVEFAKRFFANGRDDAAGVIWTPFGAPRLNPRRSLAIVNSLLSHWREPKASEALRTGRSDSTTLAGARGGRSLYVNVSTFPIWNPLYVRWLRRQTERKPVFFVHDLIALTHPEYFPAMEEIHHIHKKDAPSGTGITLAEGLIKAHGGVNKWVLGEAKQGELPINARREGEVPGTHSILYTSNVDKITITHEAFSRKGFAEGAVHAAAWLIGKKGVFGMKDMLG